MPENAFALFNLADCAETELISLLKYLDREEQAVARGFYLTGWSGSQSYTFDRIGRGQRHIDAVCIGVLGNTQPSRISEYVRRANSDGAGGDGLIQRFGLMVWPDPPGEWRNVDRYPDSAARESAWQVFARMAELDLNTALKIGGHKGPFDKVPFLRFDEEAANEFLGWREDLEARWRRPGSTSARPTSSTLHAARTGRSGSDAVGASSFSRRRSMHSRSSSATRV